MLEIFSGLVLAIVLILSSIILRSYFKTNLVAATVLTAIAFIYVGFSLKENSVYNMIIEVLTGIVFYFISIIGCSQRNVLLGYGIVLHGIWDALHHNGWIINTNIPGYWPLFCLTIDVIYGIYIIWYFKRISKMSVCKTKEFN